MGEVYRARDLRLDRTVALKVLASTLAGSEAFRERFDREARSIAALSHPNICTLHDVGRQDGIDYLVMEFLDGETLAARIARQGSVAGRPGAACRCRSTRRCASEPSSPTRWRHASRRHRAP